MKGLNCYARICDSPGIEKLHGITYVKSSFLKPVTSRPTEHVSFLARAAAGYLVRSTSKSSNSRPATVIFFVLCVLPFGRSEFLESLTRVRRRAGHYFLLCCTLFPRWPAVRCWLVARFPASSRLPFFCIHAIHRDAGCEGFAQLGLRILSEQSARFLLAFVEGTNHVELDEPRLSNW